MVGAALVQALGSNAQKRKQSTQQKKNSQGKPQGHMKNKHKEITEVQPVL